MFAIKLILIGTNKDKEVLKYLDFYKFNRIISTLFYLQSSKFNIKNDNEIEKQWKKKKTKTMQCL